MEGQTVPDGVRLSVALSGQRRGHASEASNVSARSSRTGEGVEVIVLHQFPYPFGVSVPIPDAFGIRVGRRVSGMAEDKNARVRCSVVIAYPRKKIDVFRAL